jgi:hypothetical protein
MGTNSRGCAILNNTLWRLWMRYPDWWDRYNSRFLTRLKNMSFRTKCCVCGQQYSSRNQLFKHLRSNSSHRADWGDCNYVHECKTCGCQKVMLNMDIDFHLVPDEPRYDPWLRMFTRNVYKSCGPMQRVACIVNCHGKTFYIQCTT